MKKTILKAVMEQDLNPQEKILFKTEIKKVGSLKSDRQLKHYFHNAMNIKNGKKQAIMMLAVVTIRTIKAKLGMPRVELKFIEQSEMMYAAQVADTKGFFSTAFTDLANWNLANIEYRAALADVRNHVVDGEGRKKAAKIALDLILKLALDYVNSIVLKKQSRAQEIIENAAMVMIAIGPRNVADLRIKQQEGSGSVKLLCFTYKVDSKKQPASYEFAYSPDGGATWVHICSIPNASFIATGLPTGVPLLFRKRITPASGIATDWVVSKPILVL